MFQEAEDELTNHPEPRLLAHVVSEIMEADKKEYPELREESIGFLYLVADMALSLLLNASS